MATGRLRHRLDDAPAVAIAFSPDSATLASGGADRTIRLWDMETGELRRSLTGHRDCVICLAFSPDGRTIASGSCDWSNHRGRNTAEFGWSIPAYESQWKLWDTATGEATRTVSRPGRLLSLAFAPDGKSLACAMDEEVRLHDLQTDDPGRVMTRHAFAVTSVAFTPDGAAIISGSHDQTVRRVRLASNKLEWEAPGYFEQVNSVAVSADRTLLVTGSSDRRFAVRTLKAGDMALEPGAVRLWDSRTGRLLRRLGDLDEQVMAVAISPDGQQVASGGASSRGSGIVRLFDAATGAPIWSSDDHEAEVLTVVFTPDGLSIATGGADGLVRLRDPQTGSVTRSLAGHSGGATSIAFSPDGTRLVCGHGHGGTRVWDVRTGRLLHTCRAADSRAEMVKADRLLTSAAFTPDGATFLECTASVGNTYSEPTRLWDLRTGLLIRSMAAVRGRSIALSPDGSIVACGGKSISLRHARTGEEIRQLTGYLKKVQSIAFSSDGRLLYAGGSYGTTNVWDATTGRHLITLFAFSGSRDGTITDDWLAYRPEGDYRGPPGVERYLAWRIGDELKTADSSD